MSIHKYIDVTNGLHTPYMTQLVLAAEWNNPFACFPDSLLVFTEWRTRNDLIVSQTTHSKEKEKAGKKERKSCKVIHA